MLDAHAPAFGPVLLPADRDALRDAGRFRTGLLSATNGVNPGSRELCELARDQIDALIVDPRTACFQFEGYVSMEDYRKLPYSPGRSTLGALWALDDLGTRERRATLLDGVLATEKALSADLFLAPYVYVADVNADWLGVGADLAAEFVDRPPGPAGFQVCVDVDTMLHENQRERIADAFAGNDAAFALLVVVNFDELRAPPDEVRAVLDLARRLGRERPLVLSHCGRVGMMGVADGSAGYLAGGLELESHPKRYFREGMVNLHSNTCYLQPCLARPTVQLADRILGAVPRAGDARLPRPVSMQVARVRCSHALQTKRGEIVELGELLHEQRWDLLRERLGAAIEYCDQAAAQLGNEELPAAAYHYLRVLHEVAGGPTAPRPPNIDF